MLSGYDFSNCDIPVRLTHFLMCEIWSGCEGSPKNSSISDNRKLLWERRCSEEEATQSKCNDDWIRSEFLFHTGVLLENCGKLRSFKLQKKQKNLQRAKNQVKIFRVSSGRGWNQKHKRVWSISDGGAALCTRHETWGQPVQQTTTTATPRPWQAQRDNLIHMWGGRRRKEGEGHVTENFLNKLVQKKNQANHFGRTFLKLCWVMIGWLPPLSHWSQTAGTLHSLIWQYLHCTDCRSAGVLPDSAVKQNKKSSFGRCVSFMPNGHMAGRGSDVTSALTVLLSSRHMFPK